jgi:hypothetical protein
MSQTVSQVLNTREELFQIKGIQPADSAHTQLPQWTIPKPDDTPYIDSVIIYLVSIVVVMFFLQIVPQNVLHTTRPLKPFQVT